MIYHLHAILNVSGSNWYAGKYRSYKAALQAAKTKINSNIYPVYAIARSERANSKRLGVVLGRTNDPLPVVARDLPEGALTNWIIGESFWAKYDWLFPKYSLRQQIDMTPKW